MHTDSTNASVEASIAFTKQLALSFVALVLMLFMIVTNKQQVQQRTQAAPAVQGITDVKKVKTQEIKQQGKMEAKQLTNSQVLTCEMCLGAGKKTLCMEPARKMSYCSDARTAQSTGGLCVVCGVKPTEKPHPSARPSIMKPTYNPEVTCPMPSIQDPPPQGCMYRWERCYEPGCHPCPEPKLICRTSTSSPSSDIAQ